MKYTQAETDIRNETAKLIRRRLSLKEFKQMATQDNLKVSRRHINFFALSCVIILNSGSTSSPTKTVIQKPVKNIWKNFKGKPITLMPPKIVHQRALEIEAEAEARIDRRTTDTVEIVEQTFTFDGTEWRHSVKPKPSSDVRYVKKLRDPKP